MLLTHVCSLSSLRRWTQSTHVFSYTQKWDGFLNVDHWPEFLSYESCSRDFFLKNSHHWHHISVTQNGLQKLAYLCDIFNLLNELNLSLQGRTITVFKSADKVAAFKAKLELWGQQVNIGIFDIFQTVARDFERDWAKAFFFPAGAWSPISAFKRVWALLPNYKRPPNWEAMDPRPICE